METPPHPKNSLSFQTEGLSESRMVMIYEDADSGRRAKRFSDELLSQIGDDGEWRRNLWSSDALGITEIRNSAASAAARADLVVFALSGEHELAPQLQEWIEMWAWLISGGKPAVVSLFGNNGGKGAQSAGAILRKIAKEKCLPFFHGNTFGVIGDFLRTGCRHLPDAVQWAFRDVGSGNIGTMAAQSAVEYAGCAAGRAM